MRDFDENINLEKLGKYYGQMYVRFDMEESIWDILKDLTLIESRNTKTVKGMKIKAQLAFALSYGAKLFCSMSLLQGLTSTSGRILRLLYRACVGW